MGCQRVSLAVTAGSHGRDRGRKGVMTHKICRWAATGVLFFLIAAGVGYPTLNRYDPRRIGNLDAVSYYATVLGERVEGFQGFRVLTPRTARLLYRALDGRVGTWDPVLTSLLGVNAMFVAATCLVTLWFGRRFASTEAGLVASVLYLTNFTVVNGHLAGMVDAGESFLLAAFVGALEGNLPWLVPVIGVLGGLQKETFVPLSVAVGSGWWILSAKRSWRGVAWIALGGVAALTSVLALRGFVAGDTVWPWQIAGELRRPAGMLSGFQGLFRSQLVYVFGWLGPLAVFGARGLPQRWLGSAVFGTVVAVVLGAYNDAGGNVARPIFNVAGPALCVAGALGVLRLWGVTTVSSEGGGGEGPKIHG